MKFLKKFPQLANTSRFYFVCKTENNTAAYFSVLDKLQNPIQEVEWYNCAAIGYGDNLAKKNLGQLYYKLIKIEGDGQNGDLIKLKKHLKYSDDDLLRYAARLGNADAEYDFGSKYFFSRESKKAAKWLEHAIAKLFIALAGITAYQRIKIDTLVSTYNASPDLNPENFYNLCKKHSNMEA